MKYRQAADSGALAENILSQLYELLGEGYPVYGSDVDFAVRVLCTDHRARLRTIFLDTVYVTAQKRPVTPKSPNQKAYIDAMRHHDMVFGIGPAGTGKTYLAMAMAVAGLAAKAFSRIILARPAVEAGEKLGFLPGDLLEKVNPYLRPLYDALYEMLGFERVAKFIDRNVIEVAPLAYMRGRTLNESFIILDEAQNATAMQLKMFLTRMGKNATFIITGDLTQIDLPSKRDSGLLRAIGMLEKIEGISIVHFDARDIVRHKLVKHIVKAYEEDQKKENL